jgi:hypothetical protein
VYNNRLRGRNNAAAEGSKTYVHIENNNARGLITKLAITSKFDMHVIFMPESFKSRDRYEGESVNRSQMEGNNCNGSNRFSMFIISGIASVI